MMKTQLTRVFMTLVAVLSLALAACGSTTAETTDADTSPATDTTSMTETTMTSETTMEDTSPTTVLGGEAIAELQSTFTELAAEVSAMDPDSEIAAAWNTVSQELQDAFVNLESGVEIDTEALETALDDFQQTAADSEAGEEFAQAWDSFRQDLEAALSSYQATN